MTVKGVGMDFGGTLVPIIRPAMDEGVRAAAKLAFGSGAGLNVARRYLQLEHVYWRDRSSQVDGVLHLSLLGRAVASVCKETVKDSDATLFSSAVRAHLVAAIVPLPAARDLLDRCSELDLPVGILSNWLYPTEWLSHWLERHGLAEFVAATIGSAEFGKRKPERECFDAISRELGFDGARNLAFIGDSLEEDILGARAAGCPRIAWIRGSAEAREIGQVEALRSLSEAVPFVESLRR